MTCDAAHGAASLPAVSRGRLRRFLILLAASTAFGVIATIATAAACILWSPTTHCIDEEGHKLTAMSPLSLQYESYSEVALGWRHYKGRGPLERRTSSHYGCDLYPIWETTSVETGLPWAAFAGTNCDDPIFLRRRGDSDRLLRTPTQPRFHIVADRLFPVRPAWRGFAFDTAAFGAVGFAALAVTSRVARAIGAAIQTRKGCCRACGYPIGISPVCTECGAAIPQGALT